jgi:integrase
MSIRKRGPRSYQVLVAPFPAKTLPTRAAAEKHELDLKLKKSAGNLYEASPVTLGEAIDGTLERIGATRDRRAKTIAYNDQSSKFWEPLRAIRVRDLRRAKIEDMILVRAQAHPRSAKNELEFLKRVLHDAKGRGQRFEEAILEITPVKHRPRRGKALTVIELHDLASWCPEQTKRLVLLAGQVGCRQNVWFNLTDSMLDLEGGTLTIPARLAKRRRDHRIYLTAGEVELLREQLAIRAARTSLVFPTLEGKQWTPSRFRDRVWVQATQAAAANDSKATDGALSVFDGFTFHMLRHTAASLMALAGMDPAAAAERLEHSDGGALFHKTYRHLYEGEKRIQAQRLDDFVRSVMDKEWTKDPHEDRDRPHHEDPENGRYWARTSDPQLVELVR